MEPLLALLQQAAGTGGSGLAVLAAAIFLASLTFVPRNLLILAGGVLFGWGSLPVIVAASVAAVAVGAGAVRYLFRPPLLRMALQRPRLRAVLRAIDREGWRIVALLAVAGPLPMTMQIVLFGLTGMRLPPLIAVATLGHIPQAILFVYLGTWGGNILRVGPPPALQLALLGLGAATLALVVGLISARARALLRDSTAKAEPTAGA